MEAGKARLSGNTKRQASSSEVDELRQENEQLKQAVAELLENRVLKKVYLARTAGGTTDALHARREAGNHLPGGDVGPAGEADTGGARCTTQHVLPLVRTLAGGRRCRTDGPTDRAAAPLLESQRMSSILCKRVVVSNRKPVFKTDR